ncbi:NAD+ synthase (glutamine-hydrolysing) [Lacrimispora xylanisolvens]|uniref:Glutamine-dependent NAD(+) synthetase n=1 Tax=Lacrimispora xylanisolvens TaxID=384636 RepID=A0A2S6HP17_9FIRM|nr:NAD(+) synthase [Hungatella xylanolytica]PPK79115.1 NAD+ synthase (glutamine-hydrolysing) [Hungatella xylanolytica]
MKHGYIRVAAATPDVKVADPQFNRENIVRLIREGIERNTKIMVFPELCLTAYTCADLFGQDALLTKAKEELKVIVKETGGSDLLAFIGLPWERDGKLYNTAAAVQNGRVLGLIPKTNLPNYSEFYELRYFEPGNKKPVLVSWEGYEIPMGTDLLFACKDIPGLVIGTEICEDAWVPNPPSIRHAVAGATVIVNCSASDETTGKDLYRRSLITGHSASLVCGYIYANAGEGESTQDLVFGGQNLIAENGLLLAESKRFGNETIYADMDLERLIHERRRMTTFPAPDRENYLVIPFTMEQVELDLKRRIDPRPFVPDGEAERNRRCEEILSIQAMGLKKRLAHTGCKDVVIGISGGLDSTLALLVTARAFDMLEIPRNRIHAITMPCFGTTDRTYQNACILTEKLEAELTEVNIREAVSIHFRDIGHDPGQHDVTYENSQARERTQILMDLANRFGGLVIGTGDMSELALGWATYNGDHMSMYGVNASVPKTLVRHLVRYYADTCEEEALKEVLMDVLDTPVSPELLPPKDGEIAQKTEDLVGPYELHDFFLYQILRFGTRPSKVYRMALAVFDKQYEPEVILKWLKVFYKRFFSQQFKRSCMPDGPKVGSVAVSPRGDLRMPSDAVSRLWLLELENL